MRLDLDAKVRASDGHNIGSVDRAIIDPRTNEVTSIVVRTGAIFGRDIMVPREDIERGSQDGDAIRLTLTKDELERLPDFRPEEYGPPPGTWVAPAGYAFPAGSYAYPLAVDPMGMSMPILVPDETVDLEDPDAVTLTKGALVLDRHGDDIGVVDDLRFDADSGRVQGFVLRVGGALRTLFGGGDTVEVSRLQIESVGESIVRLRLAKDEVEAAAAAAAHA
ncbi:MAG: PRC-barrel domain-containing protein [Chloroflexi bacterium]|nr:PRC-barrel domain-containing protein [Chloroflexota bacterium]